MTMRFLHPWLFGLVLLIPALVFFYLRMEKRLRPRIPFPDLSALRPLNNSPRARLRHLPFLFRTSALLFIIAALARPQKGNRIQEVLSKGIDIMMVLDISTSMSQSDFEPNRLAAAKQVAVDFVEAREKGLQNDRIGLIVFSSVAFTQCPLTVDYTILKKIISRVQFTRKEFDGTAIGTALATAVARLKDSKAKSKVVILVTDGENNRGIDPLTAAQAAKAMGVKVYVVGVVPSRLMRKVQDIFGVHFLPAAPTVDETQMKEIAKMTGGRYFRASDEESFAQIFNEIDKMEKTEVKVKEFYRYSESFGPLVAVALSLVLFELILSRTVLRRLP